MLKSTTRAEKRPGGETSGSEQKGVVSTKTTKISLNYTLAYIAKEIPRNSHLYESAINFLGVFCSEAMGKLR